MATSNEMEPSAIHCGKQTARVHPMSETPPRFLTPRFADKQALETTNGDSK